MCKGASKIYRDVKAFRTFHEDFISRFLVVMAAKKDMQMKFNISSMLRDENSLELERVRKDYEMKVAEFISKSKSWNPFAKGKSGRDHSTEVLIPVHITEKWQQGELRALK